MVNLTPAPPVYISQLARYSIYCSIQFTCLDAYYTSIRKSWEPSLTLVVKDNIFHGGLDTRQCNMHALRVRVTQVCIWAKSQVIINLILNYVRFMQSTSFKRYNRAFTLTSNMSGIKVSPDKTIFSIAISYCLSLYTI
jgi:hypothetical protein